MFAVDHGVVEAVEVARGFPGFGVQEDGAIEPDDIAPLLDEGFPPEVFDVLFERNAVGAKGVGVGKAAVDVGAGEDERSALGERSDGFQGVEVFFHRVKSTKSPW